MGKRVLVAVDNDSSFEGSIIYGIHLAARIESGLVVIAGSGRRPGKRSDETQIRLKDLDKPQHAVLERAMDESMKHSVPMEIFLTADDLFDEVTRFVRSQPSIRFIVMAAPIERPEPNASRFKASLKLLRMSFEGEILVVEKAGAVSRVTGEPPQDSIKGSSL